ncbi:MAG: phosphoglycerate dehydrogenase [Armatimonadetes bacterium]|nr:phosphoglycerate dehydrogenase [Armatimonadota bacterium]
MLKVLVSDKLAREGIDILKQVAEVDVNTGLSEEELCKIIGDYEGLVIRSATTVTAKVLEAAKKLRIIGRAGVGVDNIDVPMATEKGVIVVNSPGGNTIAAAELSVAMLLALSRNIPQAYCSMTKKEWNRSKYTGKEVYTKTLGILGLGKIGQEVAKRCQAFGMKVIAFDPFIGIDAANALGVDLVEFNKCLKRSDFISLHLPKNKDTLGLINTKQFEMMKDGVRIVNCARGGIIDDAALLEALKSGKCAGAALDVYLTEPPDFTNALFDHPNVVTTPHLGASTEEAQTNVAIDVAEQIVDVFGGRSARSAVNMPALSPEVLAAVQPYLPLAEKMASLAAQTTEGRPSQISIHYSGELASIETGPITRSVIVGLLRPVLGENVNMVNAPVIAKSRGIEVIDSKTADATDFASMLTVTVKTDKGDTEIAGTLFGAKDTRVVKMGGYPMDLAPEGYMLVSLHTDKPGVIGKVGTLLGEKNINIASMHVGRKVQGKQAIMVLNVDARIPEDVLSAIAGIEGIDTAKQVQL